ncbi:MAG TPA: prefoldin subunit beta [Nanoarchaeota archaeon]|nr:prefoldin subunit beta [Candidatus Woesearchaeota archaeon]HIH15136.1 prefoldin subunit beta [Nanoarchaeota archaeon]HIH59403.1 prefoldin subunit beta [Nanoarchaeota archaeon]HII14306.1 prefoldin subunit beta [Nanoarchaeota archaeon]HIJ04606.1 prefoldin subunit beta [Nanoarchaeota archaeon]
MDIAKDTQDKIAQLQLFEQNLHSFSTQKRNIQSQMLEIENALKEIETAQGAVYKIVGTVMFHSEKGKLAKDLKERKEVLDLRIKSFEKQEKAIEEKAKILQAEVMAELEKHMDKDGRTH